MRAVHSLAIVTLAALGIGTTGAGGSSGATELSSACPTPGPVRLVMLDRHALSGDVDGDGQPDRVFTARVRNSTDFCRYALVVVSRGRYLSVPLHKDSLGPEIAAAPWVAGTPAVDVLARLDRVRGAEMLVALWEGGSGRRFDAIFTMRHSRLTRMDASGVGVAGNVLDFGSGGSAEVTLGCDKDKPGRFYELDGLRNASGKWKITRTYYGFRNEAVVRLFERSEGVHLHLTPDFRGLLTGCAIATNWGRG